MKDAMVVIPQLLTNTVRLQSSNPIEKSLTCIQVIKAGGMETDANYPYTAEDDTCAFNKGEIAAHISNWAYATKTKNETEMQYALYAKGPLSICVDAER